MKFSAAIGLLVASVGLFMGGVAQAQDAPANDVPASVGPVASANIAFAIDLYKELARDPAYRFRNIFFSPYSLTSALTAAANGASGRTARQFGDLLYINDSLRGAQAEGGTLQPINEAYAWAGKTIKRHAEAPPSTAPSVKPYVLSICNALSIQQSIPISETFTKLLDQYFGTGILRSADFTSNPDVERQKINAVVASQTHDKVKNILLPGTIDASTRMLMTSSAYFNGSWFTPFETKLTKKSLFRVDASHDFLTDSMHLPRVTIGYTSTDNFAAIALPYRGNDPRYGDIAMVIILPDRIDGLPQVEEMLLARRFYDWLGNMKATPTEIYLPKFKLSQPLDLTTPLTRLGIRDAFDAKLADFSGISESAKRDGLHLQAMVHQAYLEVTEQGSQAQAPTTTTAPTSAPAANDFGDRPTVFRADHPFVFMLYHYPTGSILFMGRVINPASAG